MRLNVYYGRGSGNVSFGSEAAFDQLKAHDTISERWAEDGEGATSAVPYHAVDYAYINREYYHMPIHDDNCEGKCLFEVYVDGASTPIKTPGGIIEAQESITIRFASGEDVECCGSAYVDAGSTEGIQDVYDTYSDHCDYSFEIANWDNVEIDGEHVTSFDVSVGDNCTGCGGTITVSRPSN